MIQTQLIDKIDIGNHSISSILIDLIHRLISIDIGNRQKSNSEKMIYRLLSINKIDEKTLSIFIGKSSILIEVTPFFLFRFPSIDIGNQYQSSININYYRYVWHAVLPTREQKIKLSKCPTTPRRKLDDQMIRFSRISQLEYAKDTRIHISSEAELSQLSRDVIGPMLMSFPPKIW